MAEFEYDVALSFLAGDEHIAQRLADLLGERGYRVFIYSEQQRNLAGKDGVDEFSAVFRTRARTCVILFREGWGKTRWTGIEETAIKNRWHDGGSWRFLLVVSLDGRAPEWLPRTQLWLGLERFGLEGAAAAIEQKLVEEGAEGRPETPLSKAERLAREADTESRRAAFLESAEGVRAAQGELDKLFRFLEQRVSEISTVLKGAKVVVRRGGDRDRVISLWSEGRSVTLAWSQQYSNSLRYSSLVVHEFAGPYAAGQWEVAPRMVDDADYDFAIDGTDSPVWVRDGDPDKRLLSTEQLADRYLHNVLDHMNDQAEFDGNAENDEREANY